MMRKILIAVAIVVVFFGVTLFALNLFSSSGTTVTPKLAVTPPLPPASRTSTVVAPVAVSLNAIRASLEAGSPRDFNGQNNNNPLSQLFDKLEIGLAVTRGPLAVTGRSEGLTVTTPLTGSVHITGQLGTQAGKLTSTIGNLLGGALGKQVGDLAAKAFDQKTDIKGNVTMTSRPALTPVWRLEPNLTAQVNLADTSVTVAGIKIDLGKEAKPLIDKQVNDQVAALAARMRNDPAIEKAVRAQWDKLCRSVPLGGGNTGMPALWLELKPNKAFAAQPKTDANAVTLTIGVQADTRIVPSETKPACPFPAQLELVPPIEQGRLAIALPIDLPFTEVNRLLELQLKGQKFPKDADSAVEVEVRKASVAASGDRLLISLLVKANEKKSWFGLGAEATVHIYGKPAIDRTQQILRLTDLSLAVESEAVYGLLGAAARAAMPYLQDALAQNAVVDLKPLMADARTKIGGALGDFRQAAPGVTVDTAVTEVRLIGIEFDAKTLRVITEAAGTAKVAVSELPKL